jgi:hypothetical protein
MTVKSSFSPSDFEQILSQYQLGSLLSAEPVLQGLETALFHKELPKAKAF